VSDPLDGFGDFLAAFYPYSDSAPVHSSLDLPARARADVLAEVALMAQREDAQGDQGRVSGSLYSGDHEHYRFLSEVFAHFAHANVLQRDMYPSATKFEGEIIAMTLAMLRGEAVAQHNASQEAVGVLTSGGTESLMTAVLAYREQALADRGIREPNIVLPVTAHVALEKGAQYFGVEVRKAPLADDFRVDVAAVRELIDANTIALVGSAGDYGHGLIDPIAELGALAQESGIGLHVDGCLGAFLLPWLERAGFDVPPWDFRVPGVTSISADTHKYGYALKGTSVLLYRGRDLRRHQYFTALDWPGGLYVSPGMAGSRSGGLIAATWAAMITTGAAGYLAAAKQIGDTAAKIRVGIAAIPELDVIGDPLFLISFKSDVVDIYLVNDALTAAGWRMNALHLPAALHFCVTRPNTRPGVAEAFLGDLAAAVDYAKTNAGKPAASGAMYGFGGTPSGNATLTQLMSGFLDMMQSLAPGA
jgi:sphinganine-1-phosphate aldolase